MEKKILTSKPLLKLIYDDISLQLETREKYDKPGLAIILVLSLIHI